MLAQLGPRGKYEALELITKLQHKGHKGELNDANKWMHSSCCRTRDTIRQSMSCVPDHSFNIKDEARQSDWGACKLEDDRGDDRGKRDDGVWENYDQRSWQEAEEHDRDPGARGSGSAMGDFLNYHQYHLDDDVAPAASNRNKRRRR